MSRRMLPVLAVAIVAAGCGRLGTGLPVCRIPAGNPSPATLLTLQAVPDARYTPCVNAVQVGWEEIDFTVESGMAMIEFEDEFEPFLQVSLTPSCDVKDAEEVPSSIDGVTRYEDVFEVAETIRVAIIPEGERARIHALGLAADLEGIRVDDRPIEFTVDEDVTYSTGSRVNGAFFTDDYVWIIGDLDIDEGTIEMRATSEDRTGHGLRIDEALDRIDDMSEDTQYRGHWYLLFDGGCITYTFDAKGLLASSIADDAEATIGLFPAEALRQGIRDAGYDLG